jgi:glycosyltransferase involved in cell wall biosynthesis
MLPNKLFEYLALGKPIVVSAIPAIEAYFGGNSVLYYEPGNERDLASCILELYHNPDSRTLLATSGISEYQKYRWAQMKNTYLEAYEKLIAS